MLSCNDLSCLASCDETTEIINYYGIQSEALDTKKNRRFTTFFGLADPKHSTHLHQKEQSEFSTRAVIKGCNL